MRSRRLATATAALALAGGTTLVAAPPASADTIPHCTYNVQSRGNPPRDALTWKVTDPGDWVMTGIVFVHLTDLNVDKRYAKPIDPTTFKAHLNLTNKTGGHPYTITLVQVNGSHVPDDGEHFGSGCTAEF